MIVIDTHAFFWWRSRNRRLTNTAARAIEAAGTVFLPDIAIWEIAQLAQLGRIQLTTTSRAWLDLALSEPRVNVQAVTPEIAVAAASLQQVIGGDPADSIVAATAMRLGLALVTRDSKLHDLPAIETIW